MNLIQCTTETRPEDFLILAQNPATYELLGFSSTGTEYTGDFEGFQARIGKSNQLGTMDNTNIENPVLVLTNQSVRDQFNNNQSTLRMAQYRLRTDHLAAESQRKSIDSRVSAEEAQAIHDLFIAEVDKIKAEYPKV